MALIHGATLNGTVNPNGLDTTANFVYGTESTLTVNPISTSPVTIPAGSTPVAVTADITNLLANTQVFFQIVATNALGTVSGDVLNFTALIDTDVPVAVTLDATNIS